MRLPFPGIDMPSYLLKDKQIFLGSLNAPNTLVNLSALLFCALSLLVGYFISSSITYAIFVVATLLGIVICFKPEIGLYLMVFLIPFDAIIQVSESLGIIKLIGWAVLAGWMLNVAIT